MALIKQVVQNTLEAGYLTNKVEERLRRLFAEGCDLEDLDALTQLQEAIATGTVQRSTAAPREMATCQAEARSPHDHW